MITLLHNIQKPNIPIATGNFIVPLYNQRKYAYNSQRDLYECREQATEQQALAGAHTGVYHDLKQGILLGLGRSALRRWCQPVNLLFDFATCSGERVISFNWDDVREARVRDKPYHSTYYPYCFMAVSPQF
jgi:hypothetical protein